MNITKVQHSDLSLKCWGLCTCAQTSPGNNRRNKRCEGGDGVRHLSSFSCCFFTSQFRDIFVNDNLKSHYSLQIVECCSRS